MNSNDVKSLVRQVIGYIALFLAIVAFFKMTGWWPAVNGLVPGSVVDNATVAFALATTRSAI